METGKDGFFVDLDHAIRRTDEPGPGLKSIVQNCRVELLDATGAVAFAADFYPSLDALVASVPSAKLHFVAAANAMDTKSTHRWGLSWIAAGTAAINVVLVFPPVFTIHNSLVYPLALSSFGMIPGLVAHFRSGNWRQIGSLASVSVIVHICIVLYMLFIALVISLMIGSGMH